jgi:glycerate kinase
VYGPQKGASPAQVAELERRLAGLGLASADRPGAGAGGGIGGMLMELGAEAVPGAALVADEAGLDARLAGADLCITAEGRIDEQTLHGKAVAETVTRARAAGVPTVAVGGQVKLAAGRLDAELLECGDLERAGRELAERR